MNTLKIEIETYNQGNFKKCCNEAGIQLTGFTSSADGYVTAEIKFIDVMDVYWLGCCFGAIRLTSKK